MIFSLNVQSRVHVNNLHPGVNLHPLTSRSYANKLCPYMHIDLIRNLTQDKECTHFEEKFAVLKCSNDISFVFSSCMCVRGSGGGGFLDISMAECVVKTFTLHSYKSQVRKAYS